MQSAEQFLPQDYQFSEVINVCHDDITCWLNSINEEWTDVIDPGVELERDFRVFEKITLSLVKFFEADAEWSEETHRQACVALYRSMMFGVQVADNLEVLTVQNLKIGEFLRQINTEEPERWLVETIGEYLSQRPAVDALIGEYMPELDPSGRLGYLAEIGAGVMFLLSERSYGEQYFAQAISEIDPQDFEK